MRPWRVLVLVNLALVAGVVIGYAWWGRENRTLSRELLNLRQAAMRPPAAGATWTTRAIVRAVPGPARIVLTHETVPGLMEGMTMGFDVEAPALLEGLAPGDAVRVALRVTEGRVVVAGIARTGAP
jgi:Cu/Ag efflux protein CusF